MINLLKAQDALKGSSDQQLVEMMRNPNAGAPSFLVMTEIKRRTDMRKNAGGPGGYPEGTMAEEYPMQLATMQPEPVMQPQPAGIESAGQHVLPSRGYARGGAVDMFPGMTGGDSWMSNLPYVPGSISGDDAVMNLPFALNSNLSAQDALMLLAQMTEKGNPNVLDGSSWSSPPPDRGRSQPGWESIRQGWRDMQRENSISPGHVVPGMPPQANYASPGDEGVGGGMQAPPATPATPSNPNAKPWNEQVDPRAISTGPLRLSLPGGPGQQQRRPVAGPGGPGGGGKTSPMPSSYEDYLKSIKGEDPYAAYAEQMKALQVDPDKMKSDALSNALMTAGFGMMASRGNFAQAAGQGGLAGLQAYNREIDQIRGHRLQNLGADMKIAEARLAAQRGDRALAVELMKEANQRSYQDKTLDIARQRLGVASAASGNAALSAQARQKIAAINAKVGLTREVGKRLDDARKAATAAGETWPNDPVAVQKKKIEIADDIMRDFQSMELGGYGTPSDDSSIIRGIFDDD